MQSAARSGPPPGGEDIAPVSLLYDVYARTSGGVSRLFLDVIDVNWSSRRKLQKATGAKLPRSSAARLRAAVKAGDVCLQAVLCAFARSPLASLEEEIRQTALHSFGLRGRPGLSICGLLARLETELAPDEFAFLAPPDWEAEAGALAKACALKADPELRKAWERLRRLTSSLAPMKGIPLAGAGYPFGDGPTLPPEAPQEDFGERVGWVMDRALEAMHLMERIAELRKPLADAVRQAVEAPLHRTLDRIADILPERLEADPAFAQAHAAWLLAEAQAGGEAYIAEFDKRFKASKKSFGVYDMHAFRALFMLRMDGGRFLSRPFKAQLERALRHVERFRVEPRALAEASGLAGQGRPAGGKMRAEV